jgi:hypothetical protein
MKIRGRAPRRAPGVGLRKSAGAFTDPQSSDKPGDLRRSTCGRPRDLTLAQIATVLAWHDSRVTLQQLAANLGVSTSTVVNAIKSRGTHYKQAPPEERVATLRVHRAYRQALREGRWL